MLEALTLASRLGLRGDEASKLLLLCEVLRDPHAPDEVTAFAIAEAEREPVEISGWLVGDLARITRRTSAPRSASMAAAALSEAAAGAGIASVQAAEAWADGASVRELLAVFEATFESAAPSDRDLATAIALRLALDRAYELLAEADGRDLPPLLDECRAGAFGADAQLLAFELEAALAEDQQARDTARRGVMDALGTTALSAPEAQRVLAANLFRRGFKVLVDEGLRELVTCGWFWANALELRGPRRAVRDTPDDLGLDIGVADPARTALMWQATLADLLTEYAPAEAASRLSELWVPRRSVDELVTRKDRRAIVRAMASIVGGDDMPRVSTQGAQAPLTSEVWCSSPFVPVAMGPGDVRSFPSAAFGPVLVRTTMAVCAALRILRAGAQPPESDRMVEFIFHAGEVVRWLQRKGPKGRVSGTALTAFAGTLVTRAGSGLEDAIDPREFYDAAIAVGEDPDRAERARSIRRCCQVVLWLDHALPRAADPTGPGRWLQRYQEGEGAMAEEVLGDVADPRYVASPEPDRSLAACLLVAYFDTLFDRRAWDWGNSYPQGTEWRRLLIYDPADAETWAALAEEIARKRRENEAPDGALDRAAILAAAGRLLWGDVAGGLPALRGELSRLTDPGRLDHLVRRRLIKLFGIPQRSPEIDDALRELALLLSDPSLMAGRDQAELLAAVHERHPVDLTGMGHWRLMLLSALAAADAQRLESTVADPWSRAVMARSERTLASYLRRETSAIVGSLREQLGAEARDIAGTTRPLIVPRLDALEDIDDRALPATRGLFIGALDIERDALCSISVPSDPPPGSLRQTATRTMLATVVDQDVAYGGWRLNCEDGSVVQYRSNTPMELGTCGWADLGERADGRGWRCIGFAPREPRGLIGSIAGGVIRVDAQRGGRRVRLRAPDDGIDLLRYQPGRVAETWYADVMALHEIERGKYDVPIELTAQGWSPVARGPLELVARLAAEGPLMFTYAAETPSRTGSRAWLISHGLVSHYTVGEDDLTPDAVAQITAVAEEHGIGIRMQLALEEEEGEVRVAVVRGAIDDVNFRWTSLFEQGDVIHAVRRDGRMVHDPGGGLPEITVLAREARGNSVEVEVHEWGLAEALQREVMGDVVRRQRIPGLAKPTIARYERLCGMNVESPIDIAHVIPPRGGPIKDRLRGYTADKLGVFVRTETVSLLALGGNAGIDEALRLRRRGVVEQVRPTKSLGTVPVHQTSERARLAGLVEAADLKAVIGVVVDPPTRLAAGSEVFAWCRDGDGVLAVSLPAGVLTEVPVVGDVLLAAPGDAIEVQRREVLVRLLFDLVPELDEERYVAEGTGPHGERVQVFQHPTSPQLTLRARVTRPGDAIGGLSEGELTFVGGNYAGLHGGTWQRSTVRLKDRTILTGDVRSGRKPRSPAVTRTRLSLEEAGDGSVTVQREFLLGTAPAKDTPPSERRPDERERWQRRWDEHVRNQRELPVEARVRKVRLLSMRVPDGTGGWTQDVVVAEGHGPWIEDHAYTQKPAQAWITPATHGASASFRDVPAMDVGRFARERLLREDRWQELEPPLTFVQLEHGEAEKPVALFEWGYGLQLRVPVTRLHVEEEEIGAVRFPLFHGDQVQRARIIRFSKPDEPGRVTDEPVLAVGGIRYSRARSLYRQASRHKIVHAIDIVIAPGAKEIRVVKVRAPELEGEGIEREMLLRRATLSADSQAVLRERAADRVKELRCAVYARVNQPAFDDSDGRDLVFDLVRLVKTGDADPRLVALCDGDRLLVTPGPAKLVGGGNDVQLKLLPLTGVDVRLTGAGAPRWSLLRRDYSVRESALRLAYEGSDSTEATRHLFREPFLAHVANVDREQLTLLNVPPRDSKVLRAMLAVRGAGHAVVDTNSDDETVLEWEPGVRIRLDSIHIEDTIPARGGIVQVSLGDGRLKLKAVVQSDEEFIGRDGRTCMMLGKNSLLKKVVGRAAFSVAGLPNVEVSVRGRWPEITSRLNDLLTSEHGAVAHVVSDPPGFTSNDALRPFGWVELADTPVAQLAAPNACVSAATPIEWGALSYSDGPRGTIIERLRRRGPPLHDRKMVRWTNRTESEPNSQLLWTPPAGALTGRSGVGFERRADDRLTLRYDRELADLALPPSVLVEAAGADDQRFELVIAGVRGDSLTGGITVYGELHPGWVFKMSPAFFGVRVGEGSVAEVGAFDWLAYGPGDEIGVVRRILRPGEIGFLELWRVVPSRRGRLGEKSVLPVLRAEAGNWKLGAHSFAVRHPGDAPSNAVRLVVLDQRNVLRPVSADDVARQCPFGALLVQVDGRLAIAGLEDRVATYETSKRSGRSWMQGELSGQRGKDLVQALGGAVEILVTSVTPERVRYCNTAVTDELPNGSVGWAVAVAWYRGGLVLRAGRRLLRVAVGDLVSGAVGEAAAAVGEWLIEQRMDIWIRSTDTGIASGFHDSESKASEVTLLRGFMASGTTWKDGSATSGALCRINGSGVLVWISVANLGWARLAEAELSLLEGTTARLDAPSDGSYRVVGGPITSDLLRTLEIGTQVRATLVSGAVQGRGTALARLLPGGILVEVHPGIELRAGLLPDPGTTFLATVGVRRRSRGLLVLRVRGMPAYNTATGASSSTDLTVMPLDPLANSARDPRHWLSADGHEAALVSCNRDIDGRAAVDGLLYLCKLARAGDPEAGHLSVSIAWAMGLRAALSLHLEALEHIVPRLLSDTDRDAADELCANLLLRMSNMQVPRATEALGTLARSLSVRVDAGLDPSPRARAAVAASRTLYGHPEDLPSVLEYAEANLVLPRLVALARALAPSRGGFPVKSLSSWMVEHVSHTGELAVLSRASLTLLQTGFELPPAYRQTTRELLRDVDRGQA